MQLFREKPREFKVDRQKPMKIEVDYETMTHIDPNSRYLPLDNCEIDDY